MTSVARWLDDTASRQPLESLPHPGDEFPLRTFSNPPSDTTFSDTDSDDGLGATLVHPPTPVIMDQSTRRRSSSITGTAAASTRKEPRRHRRRDDHIAEEGEHSDDASDSGSRSDSTDLELDDMSADGLDDDEETGLTKKVRRKNARRKRRNTLLDQRVVPELSYTKEEKKLADQSLMRDMLVNVTLILLWYDMPIMYAEGVLTRPRYFFSISISVYNKWMFKEEKGDGEAKNIFPFPLFTTCLHMIVQFSLASLVLFMIPSLRPRHDSLNPHAAGARVEPIDPKKPLMTKWFYFSRLGPCGVATGMDIGLGNTSLKFISLTFFSRCLVVPHVELS
jgi:solute carrier family 35 protein C2